ncbi:MAG TPA: glycosyltransferase family 4 protein [Blastocatellia bacterium]|nr:glycosyltransferase family 4 protein [Blastocatellia bacterium]
MVEREDSSSALHAAHVIETLGPGGAERLLHTNLKHLDAKRVRSTVITVFSRDDYWAEAIKQLGVQVISLNCGGYRDLIKGIWRLRRWLSDARPDVLHTHLWAANVIGRMAGRLSGVPVISSIHDSDYEPETWSDGSEVSAWKRYLIRAIDRQSARLGCARMLAVSDYVRQSARRHLKFPLQRIDRLYNPVDVNELRSAKPREALLGELGLPLDSVILLNVGRVKPQKGLLYAIRALPAVKRRQPRVRLISTGGIDDGDWAKRLRAEAEALGVADRVHLLGPRRDVKDFLRACDLFVFPSLHEGLGIALIEAMAARCACVATDTGPLPEVISHGVDGWLVPPRDHQRLAEAICALLSDEGGRAALAAAAQRNAVARFQPLAAASELAAIYESMARRKTRQARGKITPHEMARNQHAAADSGDAARVGQE